MLTTTKVLLTISGLIFITVASIVAPPVSAEFNPCPTKDSCPEPIRTGGTGTR